MEKVTTFFKGDPAETNLSGPVPVRPKTEQEKKWLKRRDEARKNPPSFALVQNPKVYD